MIQYTYEISDENGYKKFNNFQITDNLNDILHQDYYLYSSDKFDKNELIDSLYNKNFVEKYDKDLHASIFELYIDNEKFIQKAKFIYSMIDYDSYTKFVNENPDIENPADYSITYNIIDSEGVKVNIYNINLVDINFVF